MSTMLSFKNVGCPLKLNFSFSRKMVLNHSYLALVKSKLDTRTVTVLVKRWRKSCLTPLPFSEDLFLSSKVIFFPTTKCQFIVVCFGLNLQLILKNSNIISPSFFSLFMPH